MKSCPRCYSGAAPLNGGDVGWESCPVCDGVGVVTDIQDWDYRHPKPRATVNGTHVPLGGMLMPPTGILIGPMAGGSIAEVIHEKAVASWEKARADFIKSCSHV